MVKASCEPTPRPAGYYDIRLRQRDAGGFFGRARGNGNTGCGEIYLGVVLLGRGSIGLGGGKGPGLNADDDHWALG